MFRNRIIAEGNWEPLALIFDGIIQQAMAHGLELGPTQVGDSVHTVANVSNQTAIDASVGTLAAAVIALALRSASVVVVAE